MLIKAVWVKPVVKGHYAVWNAEQHGAQRRTQPTVFGVGEGETK